MKRTVACISVLLTPALVAHPGHLVGGGVPGDFSPSGWQARGVRVLSHIPISDFPGDNAVGNDCWGYVSENGREYALIGLDRSICVVEVTNPSDPVVLHRSPMPRSVWHDIKVIGGYAYATTDLGERGNGIRVLDLTMIDSGRVEDLGDISSGYSHNLAANEASGYLYRIGGGSETAAVPRGLAVYDTNADPANPPLVAEEHGMYVHDAQVVTYPEDHDSEWAGREVAFCCTGRRESLVILDVTDKSNIFTLGEATYSNSAYAHQGWLSPDLRYFYMNDERDEAVGAVPSTTTRIFDVRNLAAPEEVGSFTNGNDATDHNLYVHRSLIYEANYRSGLRIFDASDPLAPVEAASLDTFPADDLPITDGAWSVYPFFPSGTVIVSDIQQGLIVCEYVPVRLDVDVSLPSLIDPAGNTQVHIQVTGVGASLDPTSVTLHLDDGQTVCEVDAEMLSPGDFDAYTPPLSCGASVRMWCSARTTDGETFSSPLSAPLFAPEAPVGNRPKVILDERFDDGLGWTVANDLSHWDGAWELASPSPSAPYGEPDTDFDGATGGELGRCFVTGEDRAQDVDGGPTRLLSPVFQLEPDSRTYMTYGLWYVNTTNHILSDLTFRVEGTSDGLTWWTIQTVGPAAAPGWSERRVELASDITRVRFVADDPGNTSMVEAAVDAVRIESIRCCVSEMNADGLTDIVDLLAYVGAWLTEDVPAERTGDWPVRIDIADLLVFLDAFFDGC